ncbi:Growth-regulating factor 8-like protein [Drosera capensis]
MGSGGGEGSGGFMYLDKLGGEVDCDVALGLKRQHQHQHHHHQLKTNHMHHADHPFLGFTPSAGGLEHQEAADVAGGAASVQRNLPACCLASDSSLKSSWGVGGGRATFSASQRRELERQTAIYKYMMMSSPPPPPPHIPPQLLLPSTVSSNNSSSEVQFNPFSRIPSDQCSRGGKNLLDLRFPGSSKDPEPWRCRRTDGKKWRCSRDVAPDQKYCERHTHKGRPSRSRKPVESPSKKTESHPYTINAFSTITAASSDTPLDQSSPSMKFYQNQRSSFLNQTPQYNQTRYSEWLLKREADAALPVSNVYQNIDPGEGGTNFGHKFPYLLPHGKNVLESGSDQSRGINQQSCMLPRQFLDAWSIGENQDNHMDEMNRNSSFNANLTLSMSAVMDNNSDHQDEGRTVLAENWMMSPIGVGVGGGASWMTSTPGGPLAEALCLGIAGGITKGCDNSPSEALPHGRSCDASTPSSRKNSNDDCINDHSEGSLSLLN